MFTNPSGITGGIFNYLQLVLLLFVLCQPLNLSAQAKLEVTEPKKNAGTVKQGTVARFEYQITNTGNQPLLITEAEVACSCTTTDFPKQPVLPGQMAVVTVSFSTSSAIGRQDRVVYLHSNDPRSPARLRFKANVNIK